MHRCIALSCLLVKALSVYLKVYFLSIVHILCKFNRFSRGGRIFSVFGCNYFFILGDFRYDEFLINPFLFPSQTIYYTQKYAARTSCGQSTRHITLFQLFENLICRHTGYQQFLQYNLSLNLLGRFGGLRLSSSLLGFQLCDFLFGLLDLRLLRL